MYMQEWIIHVMDVYGYLGICALIALENIFPPIPSEVILTFGGFMTTYTRLSVLGVVIFATLGSLIGAVVLYGIGACLTSEKLVEWTDKRGLQKLGFAFHRIEKAIKCFENYGKKAIFFGRCVPIVRSLISIPAGMSKTPFGLFLVWKAAGSFIWNGVLVSLGAALGASWEKVLVYVERYSMVIGILASVVFFICLLYKRRCKQKS